jgi:hypothetical protein
MERLWSLVGATGGNRWQGEGSETAQIRENRCRGLPPVAAENGREGSTVRVRQRALQKRRKAGLGFTCTIHSVR